MCSQQALHVCDCSPGMLEGVRGDTGDSPFFGFLLGESLRPWQGSFLRDKWFLQTQSQVSLVSCHCQPLTVAYMILCRVVPETLLAPPPTISLSFAHSLQPHQPGNRDTWSSFQPHDLCTCFFLQEHLLPKISASVSSFKSQLKCHLPQEPSGDLIQIIPTHPLIYPSHPCFILFLAHFTV